METQENKQYKSLKEIMHFEDFSSLHGNGYCDELIDRIVEKIKQHRKSTITRIMTSCIIKDTELYEQICNETQFINELYANTTHIVRQPLPNIRLYCICNGITCIPKCEICGKKLDNFLWRWINGTHKTTCSNKCAIKKSKQKYDSKPSNEQIMHLSYTSQQISKFRNMLRQLISASPGSYFNVINAKKNQHIYRDLKNFIYAQTQFIDFDCNFATRCRYVIDEKNSMHVCHKCGKPIRKNLKATEKQTRFWCSSKCLAEDDYVNNKIGKKNSIAQKRLNRHRQLPLECKIEYQDSPIVYDDEKNARIYETFMQHQKTFQFWLKQDKDLYDYFMQATYPINYINLHIGTRLYWLMHKFQEFPRCKICGRQLDFCNVKMSHEWPITCSPNCRKEYTRKLTEIRHRNYQYDRMLAQTEIQPLFSRDFYLEHGYKYENYHVKCKKCGYKFYGKLSPTMFYRGNRQNWFRCPYCHPSTKYRSAAEKRVFKFISETLGYSDAVYSYHEVIRPYELDIYVPSKKTAFEFNGILWHSIENDTEKDYHINKTKKCENKGVKLIHIWEDEWVLNQENVKQFIAHVLNGTQQLVYDEYDGKIIVDRSKFNKTFIESLGYQAIEELPVEIVERCARKNYIYHIPNCGQLVCVSKQLYDENKSFKTYNRIC